MKTCNLLPILGSIFCLLPGVHVTTKCVSFELCLLAPKAVINSDSEPCLQVRFPTLVHFMFHVMLI